MSQIFRVKVDYSDSDVITEKPHYLLGHGQNLRYFSVLDAVLGSSKRMSQQMCSGIPVYWFLSEAFSPLQEETVDLVQCHVFSRQSQRTQCDLAAHMLSNKSDHLRENKPLTLIIGMWARRYKFKL